MKSALEELQAVIERLTDAENGCPWDKEQTPESLTEYLIEESHELVSAIRSGNTADVCEELGDVAFLLLFVAHLYQKRGQFSLDDALNNNRAKMVRRHPHVFGDVTFDNLDEQLKTWEKIKRAEHTDAEGKPQGLFDSLPSSLPPLTKAYRIHSKAARVGFTWPEDEEVEQQVEAEWLEWLDASAVRAFAPVSALKSVVLPQLGLPASARIMAVPPFSDSTAYAQTKSGRLVHVRDGKIKPRQMKTPPVIGRRDSVFALTERGGAVADVHVDALAGGEVIELLHELLAVGVDDLRSQTLLLILRHGAQNALDDACRGLGRVARELEHGVDIAALAQRLEHERELGIELIGVVQTLDPESNFDHDAKLL